MPLLMLVPVQLSLPLPEAMGTASVDAVPLPWVTSRDINRLHRTLADDLGEPIDLVGTNNRRTLLSWKRSDSGFLSVRIQKQFALAEYAVHRALARYIRNRDPDAREAVHEYANEFQPRLGAPSPRVQSPVGTHHDLRRVLRQQSRRFFGGAFQARIGWSRGTRGRVRHSIRLGSWSPEHQLIRVHPVLDAADVPDFVVRFIVFHEMLHAALDGTEGRRGPAHSAEFRRREAMHPDAPTTEAWIRENLDALLSY
jgi:hypothetical protein